MQLDLNRYVDTKVFEAVRENRLVDVIFVVRRPKGVSSRTLLPLWRRRRNASEKSRSGCMSRSESGARRRESVELQKRQRKKL